MKIRNSFNLRDWGASIWERSNRPKRVGIALISIILVSLLPFAGAWIKYRCRQIRNA
jgi:branched-chain amino acid transport system permease protein